jgi:hypothetical protein
MSTILDCPSCTRKLRVGDDLVGQRVKCPTCGGTFEAGAPAQAPVHPSPEPSSPSPPALPSTEASFPPPPPLPQSMTLAIPPPLPPTTPVPEPQPVVTVPIKLSLDEFDKPGRPAGMAPPAPPPSDSNGPLSSPDTDARRSEFRRCPYCDERINIDSRRCRFCGEAIDERDDRDLERRFGVRRDCEPHRGTLVLVLGIVSIVTNTLGLPLGLPIGLPAWIMGHRDLKKIERGEMDPNGKGATQAGYICGIIGSIMGALILLFCGAYLAFIAIMIPTMNKAQKTNPPGVQQPVQPQKNPGPGGKF